MAKNKTVNFISNDPIGEDLFDSGSQKRTAESIIQHIRRQSENFRLIGLDGGWGSGKSNVISIVKKELGDSIHLFVYDAWSHQEDLQRRSFLEEFTDNLSQNNIVEKKYLE